MYPISSTLMNINTYAIMTSKGAENSCTCKHILSTKRSVGLCVFNNEIKNAQSVLLSYISTQEFLRTRQKWGEAPCLNNARGTSFFISLIK